MLHPGGEVKEQLFSIKNVDEGKITTVEKSSYYKAELFKLGLELPFKTLFQAFANLWHHQGIREY